MRKSLLPLALLLSLIVAGAACRPKSDSTGSSGSSGNSGGSSSSSAGPTYNSPDGRFSLTPPSDFSEFQSQKTTQPTPAGPIELTILQTENSRGACVAGYSDFPESSFEGRTPQKMLEDGRDGALRNINGTLEKQDPINVQGRTGLAIYASAATGGRQVYVRFNFILDKPRVYQIGFLAYDRAELDKPDVQAYFDSFRLNGASSSSSTEPNSEPKPATDAGSTNAKSITNIVSNAIDETPPPPPPPASSSPPSSRAPISGGVLNGKALSLPKPPYPAIARAAHASGTVTVQVTIDESGKVISAHAVGGHPLLQQAAAQAAYGAKFSPTLLAGKPVKVTGVLTYNFEAQ